MSETENRYVKPITDADKQKIIDSSVEALSNRPTSNATELKMRFVAPIVNTNDKPCLADEVDRIANETDAALAGQALVIYEQGQEIQQTAATVEALKGKVNSLSDLADRVETIDGDLQYGVPRQIEVSVNPRNYVATFNLLSGSGSVISTASIDLPTEELVIGGEYDKDTKTLILTLRNGESLSVPLEDVFAGLNANIIEGKGNGAVQQVADGVAEGFDFTDKNATATAKDPSLTGMLPYGAVGNYSSAFGGKCLAKGKRSHAEGTTTVSQGDYSHAEGNNSVTLGANSHAEGKQTTTFGENAHAEGFDTFAEGYISHSEGYKTHAQGACSHAEGNGTEALQDQAHAEGSQTHAKGYASHSEGEGTFAENHACHAEGKDTHANGYCSHSEGISTYAIGMYSHSQGGWTYANGDYSFAGGNDSIADYRCDFVQGEGLRTTYEHQTVFGKYNDASNWGNNRPLFMIGNGKSDSERSNAFEVRENGEVYAGGKLLQGGGSGGTKLYRHTIIAGASLSIVVETYVSTKMVHTETMPDGSDYYILDYDILKYALNIYVMSGNRYQKVLDFYHTDYDGYCYLVPLSNGFMDVIIFSFSKVEITDEDYKVEEI